LAKDLKMGNEVELVTAVVHSEASEPLSCGVKDAQDFDGVCADSIGNDVGCVGNDQLARTGNPAGAAHGGIFGEQVNGAQNFLYETAGRGWTSLS
jgi:hypothetical protein